MGNLWVPPTCAYSRSKLLWLHRVLIMNRGSGLSGWSAGTLTALNAFGVGSRRSLRENFDHTADLVTTRSTTHPLTARRFRSHPLSLSNSKTPSRSTVEEFALLSSTRARSVAKCHRQLQCVTMRCKNSSTERAWHWEDYSTSMHLIGALGQHLSVLRACSSSCSVHVPFLFAKYNTVHFTRMSLVTKRSG